MTHLRFGAATSLVAALLAGSAAAPEMRGASAVAPDGEHASGRVPGARPGGALDTDCSHVADGLGGPGYQFIATCRGRSLSPDGRFAVDQRGGEQSQVFLTAPDGRLLDDIPALSDAMPFVLLWSPRPGWFFANHHLGSGQERLRVFEIVNRAAIERSSILAEASREIVRRYPCLARSASIAASGWRWSRDGRRIALVAYARPDACGERDEQGGWRMGPDWHPLWMIGDAETGRIDPASVRVRGDGVGPMPEDGPYAGL